MININILIIDTNMYINGSRVEQGYTTLCENVKFIVLKFKMYSLALVLLMHNLYRSENQIITMLLWKLINNSARSSYHHPLLYTRNSHILANECVSGWMEWNIIFTWTWIYFPCLYNFSSFTRKYKTLFWCCHSYCHFILLQSVLSCCWYKDMSTAPVLMCLIKMLTWE